MKILVCVDGSEQSQRVLEEASKIAEGYNPEEVAIIHVYRSQTSSPYFFAGFGEHVPLQVDLEQIKNLEEKEKEKRKGLLSDALKELEKKNSKNFKLRTILEQGHPSETIIKIASDEEFDIIVIGSRGFGSSDFGGLKALLLGSVSNAVAQKTESNVFIVK